ncbi:MAG: DUF711 family protein [Candidatus Methanomethylicia archaeon]
MKVRSLTFLVPIRFLRDFSQIAPFIRSFVDEISKRHGLDIWSLRLAVDPQIPNEVNRFIDFLDEVSEDFNYYAIPIFCDNTLDFDLIVSLLSNYNKLFISMFGGLSEFKVFRDLLMYIKDKLPLESFVRLSFSIDGPIITPYFPSASAGKDVMILASMLYVNDLLNAVRNGQSISKVILKCSNRVREFMAEITGYLKINSMGLDISISPWMEESVVDLIEAFGGVKFGGIGTLSSIFRINESIKSIASSEDFYVGYNELMLPYAEDSKLMLLGGEGLISAYDLLHLSSVCVAGFDMIVLPKMSRELVNMLFMDIYSVLKSKGKPCGVRLILSDGVYGDMVDLGFIGSAPVMRLN